MGYAGGMWFLWNEEQVKISVLEHTFQEIHTRVEVNNSDPIIISCVYASPLRERRKVLWENLIKISSWLEVRKLVQSWSEFKTELLRRFHQSQQGNGYEILMAHKQTHDVGEYKERFKLLSALLKDATEEMLIGFYQNGLKEEVRAELRMTQAQNLLDIMDMSQKIKERNEVVERLREEKIKRALKPNPLPKWITGSSRPNYSKTITPTTEPVQSNASTTNKGTENKTSDDQKSSAASNTPSKKNCRRLTDEEIKRK
ncbi:Retrotransposable element Tf2 [Senna tora]|uniref:Retrotransposable element Tf2 n=1 Tax=Senna tora TaxID=362788 RepID=A0A834TGW7_9FABA|nr:Retrotransposable element Tf2 [Senna tora]